MEYNYNDDSLSESLRENTLTKLRLPLDVHSDMGALLEGLGANTSIHEVNVDMYESFHSRENADLEIMDLFRALAALPQLERLWVDSGQEDGPFYILPVQALALVLQQAPCLVRLGLFEVELLANTVDEWTQFQVALQSSPLQTLGLVGCRLSEEIIQLFEAQPNQEEAQETANAPSTENTEGGSHALDKIVGQSLAKMPNLEWVELAAQELGYLGTFSHSAIGTLCSSRRNTLTKLTLEKFDLVDSHIVALSNGLETSTTIEQLTIMCELGRVGCTALAQLLFVNKSLNNFTLRLNDLYMDSPTNTNDGEEGTRAADNSTSNKDPSILIAQALETNQTLQYFCLHGNARISHETQHKFATILRHNTTLLNCEVDLAHCSRLPEDLQLELNMFLELNELGRKELFLGSSDNTHNTIAGQNDNQEQRQHHESTPQRWVDVIWHVRHNLDSIFYLLSMNPALCDLSGAPLFPQARQQRPNFSGLSHLQIQYMIS